jgi:hypothetical protein
MAPRIPARKDRLTQDMKETLRGLNTDFIEYLQVGRLAKSFDFNIRMVTFE